MDDHAADLLVDAASFQVIARHVCDRRPRSRCNTWIGPASVDHVELANACSMAASSLP